MAPLDREHQPTHIIQVTVFDNGTEPGQLEAQVNVTFVLRDANDNAPVFDQSGYSFSVHENNESGVLIGRVRANDIDLQSVHYSIISRWSEGSGSGSGSGVEVSAGSESLEGYFTIDSESGEIFTAASFDREERGFYSFYAVATDNGTLFQHSSEVMVAVVILDLNDVAPLFSLPNYTTAWHEDTPPGTTLLTVSATDPDLEEGGVVGYSLLPSNDSGVFSINSSSGAISLVRALDRETQDTFQLEVIARDYGMPTSLTSSVSVVITVLDINDNKPLLNASQYTAVFPEDTPLNSTLVSVSASDADIGSNADVSFSLSSDFNSTFTIGSQSGVISLSSPLDFERVRNYTFFVVATDDGIPRLSTSAEVLITLIDLNDNPPVFAAETYHTSIPENAILGTSVFQIPATDADSTSNGELRYSVLSGNVEAAFEVEETSGLISLLDHLDREVRAVYSLSLRAVDLGSPQFTAHTQLTVEVTDVNDHAPQFDSEAYSVSVPELSGIGTVVTTLLATDEDVGMNANLTYSIIAGDPEGNFIVDPQTGGVGVERALDFETVPSYSLTVLVSDHGEPESQTDTAILSISILDDNEYQPSYSQSHYIISVPENTPPGSRLGTFTASDADTYQLPSLRYTLTDQGHASLFSLDQYTGHLYSLSLLPSDEHLHVTLTASDGLFTATTDVTVSVFPLSSPSLPIFQPPSFFLSVSEDTSTGERVGLLGVTNPYDVIFTMVNNTSLVDFPFEVTLTGIINLIGQLDYETTPTYLFSVQATSTFNSSLVSHAVVTIVIDDANDNPPRFESGQYLLIVPELTPVSTHLLTLTAYDLDTPGVNSELHYSITGGNSSGKFDLDPLTGHLTLAGSLDYEEEQMIVLNVSVVQPPCPPSSLQRDHGPRGAPR